MSGRNLFYIIAGLYFLFVLFAHLDDHQLEFYDEARRGVSTLEMLSGQSHPLVPSYNGMPDHWGTKPPLLIWCQTALTAIIGPGELAIRLPSAIATLLIIGLLVWFSMRQWQEPLIGVLAGWILLTNWLFIGNHGARSGDFDALLMLFTLGQVFFYHEWVKEKKQLYLVLAAISLLLAGYTKGIAGCLLLPAIGLWTLIDNNARKVLLNWRLYTAFGSALLLIVAYYFIREQYDPGYLQLVWENELGGRYLESNEGHRQPWYHYWQLLGTDKTFSTFALLAIPGGLLLALQPQRRGTATLLLLAPITFLVIISKSATKLFWYQGPALAYISLLAAWLLIFLGQLVASQLKNQRKWLRSAVVFSMIAVFFLSPTYYIMDKVTHPRDHLGLRDQLTYREALEDLTDHAPFTVLTWHYHPNARFYTKKASMQGHDITIEPIIRVTAPLWAETGDYAKPQLGQKVMLCENRTWVWMVENYYYREIAEQSPCKIVELGASKANLDDRHRPEQNQ